MSTFYDQHYTMYLARLRCSTCTHSNQLAATPSEMHDAQTKRTMTDAWSEAAHQSHLGVETAAVVAAADIMAVTAT